MLSQNVLADWSTTQYFQGIASKRYVTSTKLRAPGQAFNSQTANCGAARSEAEMGSSDVNNTSNGAHAWVIADGNKMNQRIGWAQSGWSFGENVDALLPVYSVAPMYSKGTPTFENATNFTGATLNDEGITYNEATRSISINNLNGFLRVASTDLKNNYSTFQIKVATYKGDRENPTHQRVIWSAKATIINGNLLLEGNFAQGDFQSYSEGNDKIFTISDISKVVSIPAGIDIANVLVEVSGDGGNLGMGITDKYAPNMASAEGAALKAQMQNETMFNFTVAQAQDEMIARIDRNVTDVKIDEVTIMSLDGKTLASRKVAASETGDIHMSTNGIANGVYLLMMRAGTEYYSKKVVLQN
jgi:hypothetical protein